MLQRRKRWFRFLRFLFSTITEFLVSPMKFSPRLLLFPFSVIYCIIAEVRNLLYDTGLLSSKGAPVPLISVGNLTVGGTGKTPLTEYLTRLLLPEVRCALLSRGYGRKTRGAFLVEENDQATPASIGDEPMQMKMKFPGLTIAVAEKRRKGLEKLMALPHPPETIILDDAFQHRAVQSGLSILVTDYYRPVYKDVCLPAGNLREPFRRRERADIILVNKCPENLGPEEQNVIIGKLAPFPHQQVFFSTISYDTPCQLVPEPQNGNKASPFTDNRPVVAMAGIGNPEPFFNHLRQFKGYLQTLAFPDHYRFTHKGINRLKTALKNAGPDAVIITTEKDAVKLKHVNLPPEILKRIWYLPIQLKILFNKQNTFNKTVKTYVSTNQRNR